MGAINVCQNLKNLFYTNFVGAKLKKFVLFSKISDDLLLVIEHFYHVFAYSAQGGDSLFQISFLTSFIRNNLYYSHFTPFSSVTTIFLRPGPGPNSISKTDGGDHGLIIPHGSATDV